MMSLRNNFNKKLNLPSFLHSLIITFVSIIIICTIIMGFLSYSLLSKFIFQRTLSANNKMLYQYKNTTDSLILEVVNNITMKIKLDINNKYFLIKYINSPLNNNVAEISKIGNYLTDASTQNPLIYSLGIYYHENDLFVSTEYVRHTLYTPLENQYDLKHFKDIIENTAKNNYENISLIFDYGENYYYKLPDYLGKKIPHTVIHAIRPIYNSDNSLSSAIILSVNGEVFQSAFTKYAPENLGSILIIDNNGLIISHTDRKYIGHNISELEYSNKLLESNNSSGYFISKVEGIPAVISYQQSKYSKWKYVSVAPIEAISSVANYILKIVALIAFLTISLGLIISIPAAKILAKPIQTIANYCRKSPYSIEKTNRKNEYHLISSTINNLENIMEEKEKKFKEVLPILRMNFFSALLSDLPLNPLEINARMKMLNISFSYKFFCAGTIKFEKLQDSNKVVMYEYEKLNIGSQLEKIFTTPSSTCVFYEKDNIGVVLLNFNFSDDVLYQLAEIFLQQTFKHTDNNISICKCLSLGKTVTNIKNLNTSFKIAQKGLNYYYVFPEKKFFTFKDTISWEEEHSLSNDLLLNNFSNSIKSLNQKKCISDLKKLVTSLRSENYSYKQIYATLSTCVSMVEDFASIQAGENMYLEQGFKNTNDIFEFEAWLIEVITYEFEILRDSESNNNSEIVRKAQEIIKLNIKNDQLSLGYVANELGISNKHLSRVFKNETGIKFIDYITNLKLNHCRNLLINTNLKVEEISDIMGYSTPQYFISRFKIAFGCTPKKYRQKYAIKI